MIRMISTRNLIAGLTGLCLISLAPAAMAEVDTEQADPWAAVDSAQDLGEDEERIIGRVAGIRGTVYAQTPGEARRQLTENAPIYPGDRIMTSRGAQIGVLSGEYYTGLSEDSTLVYAKRGNAAPEVTLERGDVRMINAGEGENGRIATPGMVAQAGGADTKAYAVKEKAWMVSIVCALEGQVTVADGAGSSLVVEEGGCAASKPAEGIYAAGPVRSKSVPLTYEVAGPGGAAGKPSPMSASSAPPSGDAAKRFPNPDVGAPGGFASFAARPPIQAGADPLGLIQPCDSPSSGCATASGGGVGARIVVVLPPWVGGTLPP